MHWMMGSNVAASRCSTSSMLPLLYAWIIDPKHPTLFGTQLVALVILCFYHHAFVDLDDFPWTTERRWRIHHAQLPGTNVSEVLVPLYSGTRRDPGNAQNHLDGCLVCPQEEQPDEFINLQTRSFKEGAHLQLTLSVAALASQHVTDNRHLVFNHGVVTLAQLAVELSSQYARILQILDYFLLARVITTQLRSKVTTCFSQAMLSTIGRLAGWPPVGRPIISFTPTRY